MAQRCICAAGLDNLPTIIDWQQGEWDSDALATTQANYAAALQGVVAECKRTGLLRPGRVLFIHLCTRPSAATAARNAIHAAQAFVPDGVLVLPDADIGTLGSGLRCDGTQFTMAGGLAQAALKLPLYSSYLSSL